MLSSLEPNHSGSSLVGLVNAEIFNILSISTVCSQIHSSGLGEFPDPFEIGDVTKSVDLLEFM